MKTLKSLLLTISFALLLNISIVAQNKFLVALDIQTEDTITKERIESLVTRELRSLNDIEISSLSSLGSYSIRILASKEMIKGKHIGYILSFVVTETSTCLLADKEELSLENCDTFKDFQHALIDKDDLRETIEILITRFDLSVLKARRTNNNKMKSN